MADPIGSPPFRAISVGRGSARRGSPSIGEPFEYRFPKRQSSHSAATFMMAATQFERLLKGAVSGLRGLPGSELSPLVVGRNIAFQELDNLVQQIVKPVYQKWAPESPQLANSYQYKDRTSLKSLRKSIQKYTLKGQITVGLRMNWYGFLTMEGRGALPYRPKPLKAYPILLPNGTVIFRRTVNRATIWPGGMGDGSEASGSERMRWALKAYEEIQRGQFFQQTAKNIAYRIWEESDMYRLNEEGNVRETHAKLNETTYHEPTKRAAAMRRAGVENYKKLSLQKRGRGRPRKVLTKAELRQREKEKAEKATRKPTRLEFAGKKARTGKGVEPESASRERIVAAKHREAHASPAAQMKASKSAGARKRSSMAAGKSREHLQHLADDLKGKYEKLQEMWQAGTFNRSTLMKQETRVQRAQKALEEYMHGDS